MIITNLLISHFRNIFLFNIDFSEHKTLIFGDNGAGKTSILEAIYYLGFEKSFRENNRKRMVNYNQHSFDIEGCIRSDNRVVRIKTQYSKERSLLLINDKKNNRFGIKNYFFPVFFSSDFCNLILTQHAFKRKLFDRFLFGLESLYLGDLLRYNHCIKQKNVLLKKNCQIKELESWNLVLCEITKKVILRRLDFVEKLNSFLSLRSDNDMQIIYSSTIPLDRLSSTETLFQHFLIHAKSEKKYGMSLIGPHRDRYQFKLKGKDLVTYSSGEKKMNILQLYFSYFDYFYSIRNEYPVLLVDDFDAALDKNNQGIFSKRDNAFQVIATSVSQSPFFDKSHLLCKGELNC